MLSEPYFEALKTMRWGGGGGYVPQPGSAIV